jgi:hypothetical protein
MAKSFIKFTARLAQVVRVPGKTTEHRDARARAELTHLP